MLVRKCRNSDTDTWLHVVLEMRDCHYSVDDRLQPQQCKYSTRTTTVVTLTTADTEM